MKRKVSGAQQRFYDRQFSRIEIEDFSEKISYQDFLYFGGSCFAENLYSFWQGHFLPSALSPFGSTYNPVSLKESFDLLCNSRTIQETEIFRQNDLWCHSLFNSTLSRPDKDEFLTVINQELNRHRELLRESSFLILTLGTAFVYEETAKGEIVNNCHRRPAADFRRYPLKPEQVADSLRDLTKSIRQLNPHIKIVLSLSPVRHLRDNAAENSLSKAVLRCGIDEYLNSPALEKKDSFYFPSYEILLDELRDYRWYGDDLSHPSREAVRYIMERFCEAAADEELLHYFEEAESLVHLLNHKIRFPESSAAAAFNETKEKQLAAFHKRYPMALLPL